MQERPLSGSTTGIVNGEFWRKLPDQTCYREPRWDFNNGSLGGAVRDIPDYNKAFADMTALGRVGVPDDIGPMVASLLGPDNRWVNGQRIEVSGGQTI